MKFIQTPLVFHIAHTCKNIYIHQNKPLDGNIKVRAYDFIKIDLRIDAYSISFNTSWRKVNKVNRGESEVFESPGQEGHSHLLHV